MSFRTVFIEKRIADHRITQDVLRRLPDAKHVIVEGRKFHKDIAEEMIKAGLRSTLTNLSNKAYEDKAVEILHDRFPEEAIRFVAYVGKAKTGILNRGEACAYAKSHLFLTSASSKDTLVKISSRQKSSHKKRILCCDYVQLNPVSSCPYQCLYCFETDLRGYDWPFMRFYINYKDMYGVLKQIDQGIVPKKFPVRTRYSVNMGEHADSLAQDHIFRILPEVIDWFRGFKNQRLLLLSKGGDPALLPDNPPKKKIAMAFSINTRVVSKAIEVDTPPPEKRLETLKRAYEKGYMVAIRLDPLIPWPDNWKEEIEDLVNLIHREAPEELEEITVGSMRFRRLQAALFTQMFNSKRVETPEGGIYCNKADAEAIRYLYGRDTWQHLEKSFNDNYYRLPFEQRKELYSHVVSLIKKCRPQLRVTLCQEEVEMYKQVPGVDVPNRCNCMVAEW